MKVGDLIRTVDQGLEFSLAEGIIIDRKQGDASIEKDTCNASVLVMWSSGNISWTLEDHTFLEVIGQIE